MNTTSDSSDSQNDANAVSNLVSSPVSDATIAAIARSVRSLAISAVEEANSGHPGLPLGLAELGALLFAEVLRYNPSVPTWINRDRLILSAGHGSMWLYSLLHMAGYSLSMDDIRQFRTVGSATPGHPEYGHTPGVEATTGPLGQGIATAVGIALSEAHANALFYDNEGPLVDHYTYVVASDGDIMEGISSEACSLAGHLRLNKLIVLYDDNCISIEGDTSLAFSENVAQRYSAYGWHTLSADAYDIAQLRGAIHQAQQEQERPSIICVRSIIGKGSPNKANTAGVHGSPLGKEEAELTLKAMGIASRFYIDPDATAFFKGHAPKLAAQHSQWQSRFDAWQLSGTESARLWQKYTQSPQEILPQVEMPAVAPQDNVATRKASGNVLAALAPHFPQLIGGSADLAPSNNTAMPQRDDFSATNRKGTILHFGIREHAMGAILNGIALHNLLIPFGATFLVFSDYMRPAIRLAALMKLNPIYLFTHDSIYLGEDGPTHQPIEQLASLRAIPGLQVLRPADAQETAVAWSVALTAAIPTAIVLTRQSLPVLAKDDAEWCTTINKGAYVVKDCDNPQTVLLATGSEVSLAVDAANLCGTTVRVVSVLCREILEQHPQHLASLVPPDARVVVVEAATRHGWEHYVASPEDIFCLHDFGASGAGKEVASYFNFTAEALAQHLKEGQ